MNYTCLHRNRRFGCTYMTASMPHQHFFSRAVSMRANISTDTLIQTRPTARVCHNDTSKIHTTWQISKKHPAVELRGRAPRAGYLLHAGDI